jgi:hypothetical protein
MGCRQRRRGGGWASRCSRGVSIDGCISNGVERTMIMKRERENKELLSHLVHHLIVARKRSE